MRNKCKRATNQGCWRPVQYPSSSNVSSVILSQQKVKSRTKHARCSAQARQRGEESKPWDKSSDETHANDPSLVSHLGDVSVKVRESRGQSTDSGGVHAPFFGAKRKKEKKERGKEKQWSKGRGGANGEGSCWSPAVTESTSTRGRGGGWGCIWNNPAFRRKFCVALMANVHNIDGGSCRLG